MNAAQAPEWLPSFLIPFVTLSYPVDRPAAPDSFPDSEYYAVGPLDFWYIVSIIAVFAILRDAFRLGVFEPFAKWYLTRQLKAGKEKGRKHANGNGKANGSTNGHAAHDLTTVKITKREQKQVRRSVVACTDGRITCSNQRLPKTKVHEMDRAPSVYHRRRYLRTHGVQRSRPPSR